MTAASASEPDSRRTLLEDTPKDDSLGGPPRNPDNGEIREEDGEPENGKKKKKTSKRSAGAKKRGTGFEEFYCDPPMTTAEHNEEVNIIYPPHRPFVDRIEECIQRFRARRRLGPERDGFFTRYLMLGGIDATVRQFQGTQNIGADVLEDSTRADVREMTADDVIQRGGDSNHNPRFYNPNYPEHWDVDFTGVASGFVSEHLPKMVGSSMKDFTIGVEVVLNFLKYVDRHDVCPEYAEDVKSAQKVCLQALEEMPAIAELLRLVPGPFNTALRVLHCDKDEDTSGFDCFVETPVSNATDAKLIRAGTLAIHFGVKRWLAPEAPVITDTSEYTFEVRKVSLPDDAIRAKYTTMKQHLARVPAFRPCGTFTARPVVIRDGWDNTMRATIPPEADVDHEFVLEEDMLRLLREGMKLTMVVCTLSDGLRFIKHVRAIKPSFYVFLPQELMNTYKEPVLNDRPARSIHDRWEDEEGDGED